MTATIFLRMAVISYFSPESSWTEAVTKRETDRTIRGKESTIEEIGSKTEKRQEIVVTCVEVLSHYDLESDGQGQDD